MKSKKTNILQKDKIQNKVPKFEDITDIKSLIRYIFKGEDFISHVLFFVVLLILFKFILLPSVGFVMNTPYPLTAVVSESMEQRMSSNQVCGQRVESDDTRDFWEICGEYYKEQFQISREEFESFRFSSGFNRGDVMIVYGRAAESIEVGDVILFKGQDKVTLPDGTQESLFYLNFGPIIHRVVQIEEINNSLYFTTKGDNNPIVMPKEIRIPQEDVLGTAVVRIPYLGLLNYYFYRFVVAPIRGN